MLSRVNFGNNKLFSTASEIETEIEIEQYCQKLLVKNITII